jgi:geranylgeranyl reductase family protein
MMFDVAIIGAGPAGASAARSLEDRGYSILLLDRASFPRPKPCAGVLSPKIFSELKDIPVKERSLKGYRLHSATGSKVESVFSREGLIVERAAFDRWLVDRLKTKVIKLRVSGIRERNGCVEIYGDGRTYESKLVVGADGVNSVVRRSCKISLKDTALALQHVISLPNRVIDEKVGNWFEVYYIVPYGYGWISPLNGKVKVGVGSISNDFEREPKRYMDGFLAHPIVRDKLDGGKIVGSEAHLIPMSGPLEKLTSNHVLLVGDAGGFVFPGTGEGIYYAVKSGRIAGEVAAQAMEEERYDDEFLTALYTKRLSASGLLSLRDVDFVDKVLSTPENADRYIRQLKKLSTLTF